MLNYLQKYRSIYLLLLILSLSACQLDNDEDREAASLVKTGDKIPAFSLDDADGHEVSSSSLSGKVYILNFFDTGCPDCRQEFEVLQRIYNKYQALVPVINVPRSQTKDEVEDYWNKAGLSMPFYIARDKALYSKFATSGIPRTYIVDESGNVQAAFSDSPIADYETLDNILNQLVGENAVSLSLRLKVPTRASANDFYFHNEYAITSLQLWFFDAETKKFVSKLDLRNLTPLEGNSNPDYDITYMCDDLRFMAGVYDIFAIANYSIGPDRVNYEDELLNLVDSVTYVEGIAANISDRGPVMTSRATDKLGVDLVPWINKEYMLSIDVERVLAKLQIGVSHNSFPLKHNERKYADINITNYKIVNLNTQYYLFLHKDNLPQFSEQPEFTLEENFGDYIDEGEQYVVDPLFYRKTLNAADANSFGKYYQSWFGAFTTTDFAPMPTANNYGYAYILENTSFKTSQKNGYSPGIIFKAAVNPTFVYLYDTKLKELKEEYRPEYWPNTIYLYKYNFYESIQAINIAGGLTLDELVDYTDAQLKPYGIKQCKFNMGVYETYYTYWIHHRNSPTDTMGAMQYGIVRNNFYRIVVTGISGIGNSVITPEIMRDNYPNSYEDVIIDNGNK